MSTAIDIRDEDCHTDYNGNEYCGSYIEFYHHGDAVTLVHDLIHNDDTDISQDIWNYIKQIPGAWIGPILFLIFCIMGILLLLWCCFKNLRTSCTTCCRTSSPSGHQEQELVYIWWKQSRWKRGIYIFLFFLLSALALMISSLVMNHKTRHDVHEVNDTLQVFANTMNDAVDLQENGTAVLIDIETDLLDLIEYIADLGGGFVGILLNTSLTNTATNVDKISNALDGLNDDLLYLDDLVEDYVVYYPDLVLDIIHDYILVPMSIVWIMMILISLVHYGIFIHGIFEWHRSHSHIELSNNNEENDEALSQQPEDTELQEENENVKKCNWKRIIKIAIRTLFILIFMAGMICTTALNIATVSIADVCVTPDDLIYAAEPNAILTYYVNCDELPTLQIDERNQLEGYVFIVQSIIEATNGFLSKIGSVMQSEFLTSMNQNMEELRNIMEDTAVLVSCDEVNGLYTEFLVQLCKETHNDLTVTYWLCIISLVLLFVMELGNLPRCFQCSR